MNKKDRERLKNKYIKIRDELVRTINDSNNNCEIDIDGDIIDEIQGTALLNIQSTLSIKNINKLRAVVEALDMLDNNEYGICEECDEKINIKRLEAIPGITLCVFCAEKLESNQ